VRGEKSTIIGIVKRAVAGGAICALLISGPALRAFAGSELPFPTPEVIQPNVNFWVDVFTTYSVRDFLDQSARLLAIDWREFVAIDERYLRPTEVDLLMGDASKAKRKLGWQARTSFEELVRVMLQADLELQGIADRYPL